MIEKEKRNVNKLWKCLIAISVVLGFFVAQFTSIKAVGATVDITEAMSVAEITAEIQDALDQASSNDSVTVTGINTGGNGLVQLNIPSDVTLVWQANTENLNFRVSGSGTLELAAGGKIEVFNKDALVANDINIIVNGGKLLTTGDNMTALEIANGKLIVYDGEIIADGNNGHGAYAVYCSGPVNIAVMGGSVKAINTMIPDGLMAVSLMQGGLVAYLQGTVEGQFLDYSTMDDGIIVEVDSLTIPDSYGGTNDGLTHIEGTSMAKVKWDFSAMVPVIDFMNGSYRIEWKIPSNTPVNPPVEFPVVLQNTGDKFKTINEALVAAENTALTTFTLEIHGDVVETTRVDITDDVTIIGVNGSHNISLAKTGLSSTSGMYVQNNGSLTLGDGDNDNTITFSNSNLHVTDGYINIKDGAAFTSTVYLSGTNVNGEISGGHFSSDGFTLELVNGAKLKEISGGVFVGVNDALYLSDRGTRIELISGGSFYQTDPAIPLHGHAVFVQNEAQIGEISGGYFEADENSALVIIRGGWVDEISGGTFRAKRTGVYSSIPEDDTRNTAIRIEFDSDGGKFTGKTGIGEISGGHVYGTNFGVLVISFEPRIGGAQIDLISGGTIEGTVALQNDVNCTIRKIKGGTIIGNQGMLNAGKINDITGNVIIQGNTSYGIYNYSGALIEEISGGTINSVKSDGIHNSGTINLISNGTITGYLTAINCNGFNSGQLKKITGGVYWGENFNAIDLRYALILEPGITGLKGIGRYQAGSGKIFNDELLVIYPNGYSMSIATESVTNVSGTEFHYLTRDAHEYKVTVLDSYAVNSGEGMYQEKAIVSIDAGIRPGYSFTGWTSDDGVVFVDASSNQTSFEMPSNNTTVVANWHKDSIPTDEPETGDNNHAGTIAIITISSLLITSFILLKKKQKQSTIKPE